MSLDITNIFICPIKHIIWNHQTSYNIYLCIWVHHVENQQFISIVINSYQMHENLTNLSTKWSKFLMQTSRRMSKSAQRRYGRVPSYSLQVSSSFFDWKYCMIHREVSREKSHPILRPCILMSLASSIWYIWNIQKKNMNIQLEMCSSSANIVVVYTWEA